MNYNKPDASETVDSIEVARDLNFSPDGLTSLERQFASLSMDDYRALMKAIMLITRPSRSRSRSSDVQYKPPKPKPLPKPIPIIAPQRVFQFDPKKTVWDEMPINDQRRLIRGGIVETTMTVKGVDVAGHVYISDEGSVVFTNIPPSQIRNRARSAQLRDRVTVGPKTILPFIPDLGVA